MNVYVSTLKVCLRQWKRALIGLILSAIPFANIFFLGYLFRIIQRDPETAFSLPAWKDWGRLFVDGLRFLAACFVWALPALLVIVLGVYLFENLTFIWTIIGAILILLFFYLLPSILVAEALSKWGSLKRDTVEFCLSLAYFKHWIILLMLGFVFSLITKFLEEFLGIFILLGFFISYLLWVVMARVFGKLVPSE